MIMEIIIKMILNLKQNLLYFNIKAIYQTLNDGDSIKLINENILDKISSMNIDNKKVKISNIYSFKDKGEHIPKNK